jgi:hypothetical protein
MIDIPWKKPMVQMVHDKCAMSRNYAHGSGGQKTTVSTGRSAFRIWPEIFASASRIRILNPGFCVSIEGSP